MWEWIKQILGLEKKEEIEDTMKYLIVGLGNIGSEYKNTRHNIGFDVVDYLAENNDGKWKTESLGSVCEIKYKSRTLVLLKPSTYMNRSGKSVHHWMVKKKIKVENLLIIVDDLHMDLGKTRLRAKGSDGGHNGLKDIQQILGNNKYARLKVGIGSNFRSGHQVDFVLGKWKTNEQKELPEIIQYSADAAKSFTAIGIKFTMEKFNR